jgi:two-component system, NtrC family, sensor histidine kinase KinB
MLRHTSSEQPAPSQEPLAGMASLRSLPDGVVICDRGGVVRFINPAAARLLGVDADAVLEHAFADIPGGGELREGEQVRRIVPADALKTERALRIQATPIRSGSGGEKCIGTIVVYRDATREAGDKRSVVAAIAHDLRYPLTSVNCSIGLLLHEVAGALTEHQRQLLKIAQRGGLQMLGLINDLTDLLLLDAGLMQLRYEEIRLDQIIREVGQLLSERLKENQTTLISEVQSPLPPIRGDRQCLIAIVSNLLDSDFPYSPPGPRVKIVAQCHDRCIRVDISDPALEIPSNTRQTVFNRSHRLRLAIAKELIELQNGRIWFETIEGQGTTFSFTLPFADVG